MAWIDQVPRDAAEGRLARAYAAARGRAGGVAGIITLMSLDPRSLEGSMGFYVSLMKSPNALSPARREMLATVVSNVNDCFY